MRFINILFSEIIYMIYYKKRGGIKMLRIAIVDDEINICNRIERKINTLAIMDSVDYRLSFYENAECLIAALKTQTFDIILLDIEMPGINGIRAAEMLRRENISSIVIFVTSKITYMKDAFGLNVFGFIDKSELDTAFEPILQKCLDYIDKNVALSFKTNEGLIKIFKKDIILAEYSERKVNIHTKTEKYIVNLPSLPQFLKVANNPCFIYVNRTCVINIAYLINTIDNHAHLKYYPTPIPISLERVKDVNKALVSWISTRGVL